MANLVDSAAHFNARATEYGIPDPLQTALRNAGFTIVGQLAFAVNRPGQETTDAQFDAWATRINGGVAPALGSVAALKRLHFESEIVLTSMMRSAVEQPVSEHSTPKPIPFAEKNMRLQRIRNNLPGIELDGVYEPAQSLLDEACCQHSTRVLRYIEPSKCTSRELEITQSKVDKKLKIDSNTLTVKESKTSPDENISAAFHVQQCLRRRAIAYEFAGLISYNSRERYVNRLMRHLSIEPPPHFQQVSLTQILRADRDVFVYCSQNVQDIRANAAGVKPLDDMLERALADYNTAFHLMPLPAFSSSSHPYPRASSKGKKGKGKGKFSVKGAGVAPRGFVGRVGRDNKGRNLCFDWNIKGCDKAPAGGECENGRHNCFKL